MSSDLKAWVVTAEMGYGHQRAVYPFKEIAEDKIISVGSGEASSQTEKKHWRRVLGAYEFLSRAKSIPVIGNPIFNLLDAFLHIPSFYPIRNLSSITFQTNLLEKSIKQGLCEGMLKKAAAKNLSILTSFYAPAVAADMKGFNQIYCIICDADLNRVWVAKDPYESRIKYFAPCGKAAQRLRAYGVPDERIFLTGFPLPQNLVGEDISILKRNLSERLFYLDPQKKFRSRHGMNVNHYLGGENYSLNKERALTITYAVGGAGAQKEIGKKIAVSLKKKIREGKLKLNLVAGTREPVNEYFQNIKTEIDSENIEVIFSPDLFDYFDKFNDTLHTTDILWTKPSELSFYSGLGIPIIMAPAIGSQEKFNSKWLLEIHAGIKQENPDFTDQWLYDYLNKGMLAEAAWSGFLKARKLGTYKILEVLKEGKMNIPNDPVLR